MLLASRTISSVQKQSLSVPLHHHISTSRLTARSTPSNKASSQQLLPLPVARAGVSVAAPHLVPQQRRQVVMAASNGTTSEEIATLGGGCFWCVEACYNQLRGVYSAISGYEGGHVPNPTYEQVCGKNTGHVEVVQVKYDPTQIDYRTILQIFFTIHDPTTKDRQGNDVGPQYRSVIMYHNEEQKKIAEEVMKQVSEDGWWSAPLVTELLPTSTFYKAEKYHQRYYEQNPTQGYCAYVVGPKVAKFRAKWAKLLTTSPVA